MLFNSYEFLLLFLPITFIGYTFLSARSGIASLSWLTAASLFFYGWWSHIYVLLLIVSIGFNYITGLSIGRLSNSLNDRKRYLLLSFGVACNLSLLAYYKYADFFIATVNRSMGTSIPLIEVILPIGISFFTFTQIAFLVDTYRGKAKEYNPIHYGLFVTYFPHLIAGPILHHKEMMPQFSRPGLLGATSENIAVGLSILVIGLFKKVVLADGIAPFATQVFAAAAEGNSITFMEGWGGALSYSLQLYFDFSGYSDMAVGLSLLFGVRLPANFDSPYKAINMIDFWRRWHITLSRFLRDYLYIPLGGNRGGHRYRNLIITMLLGGLWHGASWTFVIWGGLHGVYLMLNHAWLAFRIHFRLEKQFVFGGVTSRLITFVAVVVAWVFFRAENLKTALGILKGMAGLNGVVLPGQSFAGSFPLNFLEKFGLQFGETGTYFQGPIELVWIVVLLLICNVMPNIYEIFHQHEPALVTYRGQFGNKTFLSWAPNPAWVFIILTMAGWSVLVMTRVSSFLYFQF